MNIKKFIIPVLGFLLLFLLIGCSLDEVDSRDDANRILLSVSSSIAECEVLLNEYEKDVSKIKQSDLEKIENSLAICYEKISSCNSYKDIEDVKPKYDSSMDKYNRAIKHLNKVKSDLKKWEDK